MILLLDLDDTLLGNSMDSFLPAYLKGLADRLAPYAPAEKMVKYLMAGTRHMIENQSPNITLEQVFDSVFYPGLGERRADLQPILDAFYAEDFPKLRVFTEFRPEAVKLVEIAQERGYKVAIATNPLFPRTAILQCLSWAGLPLDQYPSLFVPDFESFHFAKPRPHYYAELLARLGWLEDTILMVGDDVENDILPASQLGLPVFWVPNQHSEWIGSGEPPPQGNLGDVLSWIDETPVEQLMPNYASHLSMQTILRSTPAFLHYACLAKSAAELASRPAINEWSIGEVVCHMRDVEKEVFLPRLKKVIGENNPFLSGQDTDSWAESRAYIHQDACQALDEFTNARLEQLTLLSNLSMHDWERKARHAIFGPTRLDELVNITAGHDRLHIQQVHRMM